MSICSTEAIEIKEMHANKYHSVHDSAENRALLLRK